ncbi:conjugal transfer protein TraX [Paenibacillus sp. N1-5-1-14]|uniref:conjugal transfer protein TraX n=1 Tax=Paenibacillus radicibacter TaxID=2972488 RepID=UPI0021599C65|nr:conjugal transfer protein TraX [Paenibacillus radicibacter]MCR8644316.1 conjugal transfer protein TraX [Paenibacillus radicibacter]
MNNSFGLNAFQLKIIALVLMVLDHVATFIPDTPNWFHWVGRIVAPIFFYLIVEGFFHTRSRTKYMKRLFACAFIMIIGNLILNLIFRIEGYVIMNHMFLSLALGILMLHCIDLAKSKVGKDNALFIILAILVAGAAFFTEASMLGVLMTLNFYFLRNSKWKMAIGYLVICAFELFILTNSFTEFEYDNLFLMNVQWMMFMALPFMLLYNGARGLNTPFTKNLFYLFYPVHLWIIFIIGYFMRV